MENAVEVYNQNEPLTAVQVKAQVQRIQEIMKAVMEKDVHYGVIPGTPKPTLYKPGSEKILSTFHVGVDPETEDLSNYDEVHYRVKAKGFSQATGALLGVGVGECSSNEEKYKWRKPVCDEEFNETPEDRKRIVWKKGDNKPYQLKQIRTNPADVANTILKMAKKRAQIDMTLTVTAASDIFEQDLEDIPEETRESLTGNGKAAKPPLTQPGRKSDAKPLQQTTDGNAISDAQRKRLYAIYKNAGKTDDEVKEYLFLHYDIGHSKDIPRDKYDEIIAWAEAKEEQERQPGEEG